MFRQRLIEAGIHRAGRVMDAIVDRFGAPKVVGELEKKRERIIFAVLYSLLVFGLFSYLSSLLYVIREGHWPLQVAASAVYGAVIGLCFIPRLSPLARGAGALAIFYISGLTVLLLTGLGGSGRVLLLTYSVLSSALFGIRAGLLAVLLTSATYLLAGWGLPEIRLRYGLGQPAPAELWRMTGITFLGLNAIVTISLGFLVEALVRTWRHERRLGLDLDRERDRLSNLNRNLNQEIGNRIKTQAALVESEQKYRNLVESVSDILMTHDLAGRILTVNQAIEETLGKPPQDLVGRNLAEFVAAEDQEFLQTDYLGSLRATGSGRGVVRLWSGEGEKRYIDYRAGVIEEPDGTTYVSGSGRDVTTRIEAEKRLRRLTERLNEANKMEAIGRLSSGIAHDFNNLLQAIGGHAQLAAGTGPGAETAAHLKGIERAVDRATDLVRRLLTFSRHDQPQLRLLDLHQVIRTAVNLLVRTVPKMIEIKLDLKAADSVLMGDRTQLEQIIMNLGTNARDAMAQGGRLMIETEDLELGDNPDGLPDGPYVRLRVTDTGGGIEPETKAHIFEPFYTTKEVGRGTGLGLSTVYGIVRGHGGAIECESVLDRGTSFTILLPVRPGAAPPDQNHPVAADWPEPGGNQELVLVVDDERSVRETVREILTGRGYRVTTAASGEAAIQALDADPRAIDLVILDLGMPGMGGRRCLAELKAVRPDLKVIISSGYALAAQTRELGDLGASGFVPKPYRLARLLTTVREVLDLSG